MTWIDRHPKRQTRTLKTSNSFESIDFSELFSDGMNEKSAFISHQSELIFRLSDLITER